MRPTSRGPLRPRFRKVQNFIATKSKDPRPATDQARDVVQMEPQKGEHTTNKYNQKQPKTWLNHVDHQDGCHQANDELDLQERHPRMYALYFFGDQEIG
jgi:hypothetical protein